MLWLWWIANQTPVGPQKLGILLYSSNVPHSNPYTKMHIPPDVWCVPKSMVSEVVLNQDRRQPVPCHNDLANALRAQDMTVLMFANRSADSCRSGANVCAWLYAFGWDHSAACCPHSDHCSRRTVAPKMVPGEKFILAPAPLSSSICPQACGGALVVQISTRMHALLPLLTHSAEFRAPQQAW